MLITRSLPTVRISESLTVGVMVLELVRATSTIRQRPNKRISG